MKTLMPCRLCGAIPKLPSLYSEGYAKTHSYTLRCGCGVSVEVLGEGLIGTGRDGHEVAGDIAQQMEAKGADKWNALMAPNLNP